MPDWRCTTCGAINLPGQRECEACGQEPAGPVARTPAPIREWQHGPAPCTPEETERALQLVKAVVAREVSMEQAHLVLAAMFQGREVEL